MLMTDVTQNIYYSHCASLLCSIETAVRPRSEGTLAFIRFIINLRYVLLLFTPFFLWENIKNIVVRMTIILLTYETLNSIPIVTTCHNKGRATYR